MEILLPESLEDALVMLAAGEGEAIPLAGGTDLLVGWPERPAADPRVLVDLSGLDELRPLRFSADELVLGALTTYWDVIADPRLAVEFPLLVAAARRVGSIQIQVRGTWAGNIANASPAADGVPALMAYDAAVVLASTAGSVEIPLAELYLDYKVTRRRPDQLIREIRIPRREHSFHLFEKVGSRSAQAITKVGVAVARSGEGWRVVANSMAPTVRRCGALEEMLESGAPVRCPADLLPAIGRDLSPIDDLRSTTRYRTWTLARVLYHGLKGACSSFS